MAEATATVKDVYSTLGVEISLPKLWQASQISPYLVNHLIQDFYKRVNAAGGSHELAAVGLDFAMREWHADRRPKARKPE